MAQRYNIHTKSQRELYREYRNLLKRTRRFKGTHIEVENTVSKLLEQARTFFSMSKLSPKIAGRIKALTKEIHGLRKEKLSSVYVSKESLTQFRINDRFGVIQESAIMSDRDEALKIIKAYREELIKNLTNVKTGKEHRKSGDDFKGLDSLLNQLDEDIEKQGVLAVATMISQFKPDTSMEEKYYSIESWDFLRSIGFGTYELPENFTDEEAEGRH